MYAYMDVATRKRFPNVSSTDTHGLVKLYLDKPPYDPNLQDCISGEKDGQKEEFVNGKWRHVWVVVAKPEEEVTAYLKDKVRKERDAALLASDFSQLPDAPIANKTEWMQYRQQLREFPDRDCEWWKEALPQPPTTGESNA